MAAAIEEAKQFLFRHPWATTEVDNPVQLLQEVIDEVDRDYELIDEGMDEADITEIELLEMSNVEMTNAKVRLLAFIKGLRDDLKISEAEYQIALSCAK